MLTRIGPEFAEIRICDDASIEPCRERDVSLYNSSSAKQVGAHLPSLADKGIQVSAEYLPKVWLAQSLIGLKRHVLTPLFCYFIL